MHDTILTHDATEQKATHTARGEMRKQEKGPNLKRTKKKIVHTHNSRFKITKRETQKITKRVLNYKNGSQYTSHGQIPSPLE